MMKLRMIVFEITYKMHCISLIIIFCQFLLGGTEDKNATGATTLLSESTTSIDSTTVNFETSTESNTDLHELMYVPYVSLKQMRSRHKPNKIQHDNKEIPCMGWCLTNKSNTFTLKFDITVDPTADKQKRARFYLIKSLVDKYATYPIRVDMNVYADESQYSDHDITRLRSYLFNKNLLRIPTEVFYPLTKQAIRKALIKSGNLYVPHHAQSFMVNGQSTESRLKFLVGQQFSNAYFETNPVMYRMTNFEVTGRRFSNIEKDNPGLYSKDPFNIKDAFERTKDDTTFFRRSNDLFKVKTIKLKNFLNMPMKRTGKVTSHSEVKKILGLQNDESILEKSPYHIDDIIGGLKTNSNTTNTLVIGASKAARSKLFSLLLNKSRSQYTQNRDDTGIIIHGKQRSQLIDVLLRSMAETYQYGARRPVYKQLFQT